MDEEHKLITEVNLGRERIHQIHANQHIIDKLVSRSEYEVSSKEEWENTPKKGYLSEIPVIHDARTGSYWIEYVDIGLCKNCSSKKMHDSKLQIKYCPVCESKRPKWKRKIFKFGNCLFHRAVRKVISS